MGIDKYMFKWCKDCGCLQVCYYQHGDYIGEKNPCCLEPACYKGPAAKEVK